MRISEKTMPIIIGNVERDGDVPPKKSRRNGKRILNQSRERKKVSLYMVYTFFSKKLVDEKVGLQRPRK